MTTWKSSVVSLPRLLTPSRKSRCSVARLYIRQPVVRSSSDVALSAESKKIKFRASKARL